MAIIMTSVNQRVLEIVKEDPGVSCQHITDRLGDVTVEQVSNALAHLRRTHQIVNLGKHARGASWYPKDK
jgi:predicted transcriptional regulator